MEDGSEILVDWTDKNGTSLGALRNEQDSVQNDFQGRSHYIY